MVQIWTKTQKCLIICANEAAHPKLPKPHPTMAAVKCLRQTEVPSRPVCLFRSVSSSAERLMRRGRSSSIPGSSPMKLTKVRVQHQHRVRLIKFSPTPNQPAYQGARKPDKAGSREIKNIFCCLVLTKGRTGGVHFLVPLRPAASSPEWRRPGATAEHMLFNLPIGPTNQEPAYKDRKWDSEGPVGRSGSARRP